MGASPTQRSPVSQLLVPWRQLYERTPRITDRHGYSHRVLARLVLSSEAQQVASYAEGLVTTYDDGHAHPGEFIEQAMTLVEIAQEVLRAAVLYERQNGVSWDSVGDALGGIARQSAHARYAEAEADWKQALVEPLSPPDDAAIRDDEAYGSGPPSAVCSTSPTRTRATTGRRAQRADGRCARRGRGPRPGLRACPGRSARG